MVRINHPIPGLTENLLSDQPIGRKGIDPAAHRTRNANPLRLTRPDPRVTGLINRSKKIPISQGTPRTGPRKDTEDRLTEKVPASQRLRRTGRRTGPLSRPAVPSMKIAETTDVLTMAPGPAILLSAKALPMKVGMDFKSAVIRMAGIKRGQRPTLNGRVLAGRTAREAI